MEAVGSSENFGRVGWKTEKSGSQFQWWKNFREVRGVPLQLTYCGLFSSVSITVGSDVGTLKFVGSHTNFTKSDRKSKSINIKLNKYKSEPYLTGV